jgi:hypothetical protein
MLPDGIRNASTMNVRKKRNSTTAPSIDFTFSLKRVERVAGSGGAAADGVLLAGFDGRFMMTLRGRYLKVTPPLEYLTRLLAAGPCARQRAT